MDSAKLMAEARKTLGGHNSAGTRLQRLCNYMTDQVEHYDWFGFYLVVPGSSQLALGPFSGEPTEHVRIPFGRGICGQAAERQDTLVVQDVSTQTNYLSCSPKVNSEIVVPIFDDRRLIGEIDIDSHMTEPFTDEDSRFLESLAGEVGPIVAVLLEEFEQQGTV